MRQRARGAQWRSKLWRCVFEELRERVQPGPRRAGIRSEESRDPVRGLRLGWLLGFGSRWQIIRRFWFGLKKVWSYRDPLVANYANPAVNRTRNRTFPECLGCVRSWGRSPRGSAAIIGHGAARYGRSRVLDPGEPRGWVWATPRFRGEFNDQIWITASCLGHCSENKYKRICLKLTLFLVNVTPRTLCYTVCLYLCVSTGRLDVEAPQVSLDQRTPESHHLIRGSSLFPGCRAGGFKGSCGGSESFRWIHAPKSR